MEWGFWEALAAEAEPVIDRTRGSVHPQYSHIVYPLDCGRLSGEYRIYGRRRN